MASMAVDEASAAQQVRDFWHSRGPSTSVLDTPAGVAGAVRLILHAVPALPAPGTGGTWQRFDALAAVGSLNLSVARLIEAHYDAVAILGELAPELPAGAGDLWGVWAAEPPGVALDAEAARDGTWRLTGRKAWCSGAAACTHALVTAHAADGPRLFAVSLAAPAVQPAPSEWTTAALAGSDTRAVDFDGAVGAPVGAAGQYVDRPGFWHGAIGVAAVWYGGAAGVGRRLLDAGRRHEIGDLGRAQLGAVGAALQGARATLQDAAQAIDLDPRDVQGAAAIRARGARAVVEAAASEVIERVGRALGPGPLATDTEHLRRVGDLALYLRQSHAERDLADLGSRLIGADESW